MTKQGLVIPVSQLGKRARMKREVRPMLFEAKRCFLCTASDGGNGVRVRVRQLDDGLLDVRCAAARDEMDFCVQYLTR